MRCFLISLKFFVILRCALLTSIVCCNLKQNLTKILGFECSFWWWNDWIDLD